MRGQTKLHFGLYRTQQMAFVIYGALASAESIAFTLEQKGYDVERAYDAVYDGKETGSNLIGQYFLAMRRYLREHKAVIFVPRSTTQVALTPRYIYTFQSGEGRTEHLVHEFFSHWLPNHTVAGT